MCVGVLVLNIADQKVFSFYHTGILFQLSHFQKFPCLTV